MWFLRRIAQRTPWDHVPVTSQAALKTFPNGWHLCGAQQADRKAGLPRRSVDRLGRAADHGAGRPAAPDREIMVGRFDRAFA
jgi:hypothetical protein